MVWDQLSINKPHLVYIILGGFTSIFMLVSLFIKEKLYIGEATVATLCGLIFGPHAANLIDPSTWGNQDQITLEFSRIVLVVQCFAVGVELPKAYMERHWLSVVLLLVPVMTFGWLITSLFIWWMIVPLTWLESLCAAACVTATDPVLASSVVGKGKFAKRVPKHIRDLLSAESGCNDGMAFPFIYLALYLIQYHLDAKHVVQHWFCNTILYECVWGAVYGVLIGYIARQAIKLAERKGIIDRESFLVFYFVLALFCAGSGSMLGMDDLLVGFAAGVGFSNDGWFTEKTEESHVSNVIDLLLNLTYFVYLGTIIPWDQYNSTIHGLEPWRLVVIALLVIFFRRIPIMLMLKPIIPDIKTWREALFCGHFGPIGVGAIFVAILARAELETGSTTPLAVLPDPSDAEYTLIYTIWPITTFLVIASIVVHGSSIAVFTLGKRINTLTMTLSYTTGNDQSSSWMNRLPRIASTSKSMGRSFTSDISEDEKVDAPPGQLPPIGIPKLHLRRQKDDEYEKPRSSSRNRSKRRRRKSHGAGGPVSDSAITPKRRSEPNLSQLESGPDQFDEKFDRPSPGRLHSDQLEQLRSEESDPEEERRVRRARKEEGKRRESDASNRVDDRDVDIEAYDEAGDMVIEDEEGNVLETVNTKGKSEEEKAQIIEEARNRLRRDTSGKYAKHKHEPHEKNEGEELEKEVADAVEHPEKHFRSHFKNWKGFGKHNQDDKGASSKKPPERKRGPAHAYQFGSTIIIEDEDGEVIHKYDIPKEEGEGHRYNMRGGMQRMGTWVGLGRRQSTAAGVLPSVPPDEDPKDIDETSSSSPEKEKEEQEPTPKPAPPEAKNKKRKEEERSPMDDGLRMVISNAEQYGLTGLQKPRQGERPDIMGKRRMSTKDFIASLQQLDQADRSKAMNKAGVSEGTQKEINRIAKPRQEREREAREGSEKPTVKRAGTMPLSRHKSPIQEVNEEEEPVDYFAPQPSKTQGGRQRAQSDAQQTKRPEPLRAQTDQSGATKTSDSESEEDVPTHNVRGAISRYGGVGSNMTSAEARRQRYSSVADSSERIDEREEEEDPNAETAAEKRRRLAALGLGGGNESESSDEEDEGPRVPKRAVPEPSDDDERSSPTTARFEQPPPREREQPAQPPRMRVQWGGETRGTVRGEVGDDVEKQAGAGEGSRPHAGLGKRFKTFLDR
ncbi:Na+/H+ antiporter [Neophaeococcomyces mojaviensis]|uniref:Na+/H+ antiporter n=1 Tax=Neophaeococcomyces mojaviensis TaxID=3383035 RepID=A0ACC3A2H0_9EURO|nr:Na+/H+ antiporter [Knufia sp. JES_112]